MDTRDKFLSARDQHISQKKETPDARNTRLQLNSSVPTTVREELSSRSDLRQADYDLIPEMVFKKVVSKGKSFKDACVPVRICLYDFRGIQVPRFEVPLLSVLRLATASLGLGLGL